MTNALDSALAELITKSVGAAETVIDKSVAVGARSLNLPLVNSRTSSGKSSSITAFIPSLSLHFSALSFRASSGSVFASLKSITVSATIWTLMGILKKLVRFHSF